MTTPLSVVNLEVEHRFQPLGLGRLIPRFTWQLAGDGFDRRQTAYRVEVFRACAGSDQLDTCLWDSGVVESCDTHLIPYAGASLTSRDRCLWRVAVRDEAGRWSSSALAVFEMGLVNPQDLVAQWVHPDQAPVPADRPWAPAATRDLPPAAHLRCRFVVTEPPVAARLYATAHGVYRPYLNGARVGTTELAPGWTDYRTRVRLATYEVTNFIQLGANTLGVLLGDGWYSGYVGYSGRRHHYGSQPALAAQLELTYADGHREIFPTGPSWTWRHGAIQYSDLLMGEAYDARAALPHWCDAEGADDDAWRPVAVDPTPVHAEADSYPPVQVTERRPAQTITPAGPDTWLVDFGQNLVGYVSLTVSAPAGTVVTIAHGEVLDREGRLYRENLRAALATDLFITAGGGRESFTPHFTLHGFRYATITGHITPPTLADVTALVVETQLPVTGHLHTGHDLVNRIQHNIVWGQRSNFVSVPTDCPQRDERLGWLGDAQVFCRTATFNRNVAAFFTGWMESVRDGQSPAGAFPDVAPRLTDSADGAPGWGNAGVLVPWTLYQVYKDRGILSQNYAAMTRWMAFLAHSSPDGRWRQGRGHDYGDWLAIGEDTSHDLLADAFYAQDARLMARIARVLGNAADGNRYELLAAKLTAGFQADYVTSDGTVAGDTQTGYALALALNLLPPHLQPAAARHLVDNIQRRGGRLATGFLGVGHLLPVLSDWGYDDVAVSLLLSTKLPSWGYQVMHGATTIWERWDGWTPSAGFQDPGMNSFNHYALGSVGEWLYRYLAGIDAATPGFRSVRIRPHMRPEIGSLDAAYDSIVGRIAVRWSCTTAGFLARIVIPANVTAVIQLPAQSPARVRANAPAATVPTFDAGQALLSWQVGSGTYEFSGDGPR